MGNLHANFEISGISIHRLYIYTYTYIFSVHLQSRPRTADITMSIRHKTDGPTQTDEVQYIMRDYSLLEGGPHKKHMQTSLNVS